MSCSGIWTPAVAAFPEGRAMPDWVLLERPQQSVQPTAPGPASRRPAACCQPLDGAGGDPWVLGRQFSMFWEMHFSFPKRGLQRFFCTWLLTVSTTTFLGGFIISCLPQCWVEVSHSHTVNVERLRCPLRWASIHCAKINAPNFLFGSPSNYLIIYKTFLHHPNPCFCGYFIPNASAFRTDSSKENHT